MADLPNKSVTNVQDQVLKKLLEGVFKESMPSDLSKVQEIYNQDIKNAIDVVKKENKLREELIKAYQSEIKSREKEQRERNRSNMNSFQKIGDNLKEKFTSAESKFGSFIGSKGGDLKNIFGNVIKGDLKGVLDSTKNLIGVGSKLASVGTGVIGALDLVRKAFDNYAAMATRNLELTTKDSYLSTSNSDRAVRQGKLENRLAKLSTDYTGDSQSYLEAMPKLAQSFSKSYLNKLDNGGDGYLNTKEDLIGNMMLVGTNAKIAGGDSKQAQDLFLQVQRIAGGNSNTSANAVNKFYDDIVKKFDKLPTSQVSAELISLWDSTKHLGVGLDSLVDTSSKYEDQINKGILSFKELATANKAASESGIVKSFQNFSLLSQKGLLANIGKDLGKEYEGKTEQQLAIMSQNDPRLKQYMAQQTGKFLDTTFTGENKSLGQALFSQSQGLGYHDKAIAESATKRISLTETSAFVRTGSDASASILPETGKQAAKINEDLEETRKAVKKIMGDTTGVTKDFKNAVGEATTAVKNFTGALAAGLHDFFVGSPRAQSSNQISDINPNR